MPVILIKWIEEIYFFEVNTKYISLSGLKKSYFSRVHSTSENADIFTTQDKIYLVFAPKKVNFLFILYWTEIQKAQPNLSLVVSRLIWLFQLCLLGNSLESYFKAG